MINWFPVYFRAFSGARDFVPLGCFVTSFDREPKAGGFTQSQIPRFRMPESVIDDEAGYILDLGVDFKSSQRVESMSGLQAQGYHAVFVGCVAPPGVTWHCPGARRLMIRMPAKALNPQTTQVADVMTHNPRLWGST